VGFYEAVLAMDYGGWGPGYGVGLPRRGYDRDDRVAMEPTIPPIDQQRRTRFHAVAAVAFARPIVGSRRRGWFIRRLHLQRISAADDAQQHDHHRDHQQNVDEATEVCADTMPNSHRITSSMAIVSSIVGSASDICSNIRLAWGSRGTRSVRWAYEIDRGA